MDRFDYNPTAVKDARVKAGYLRQEDVASVLGCSRKLVSECETGSYVSFEWLQRFATTYKVPVKDWLYDARKEERDNLAEQPASTEKILT